MARCTLSEQELVARAKAGDQDAFEQLVLDNQARIYNLALRMTGSAEDALDLSQEAFLNAWKGLGSFKGDSAFSTWLYRLASNACLDFLRTRKRRQQTLGVPLALDDDSTPPIPAGEELQPGARLEQRERQAALRRALDALPPHHKQVLVLRELSGLSYQELSQALDLDMGTVKSRLTRARLALKKILMEDGNFFSAPPSNSSKSSKRK